MEQSIARRRRPACRRRRVPSARRGQRLAVGADHQEEDRRAQKHEAVAEPEPQLARSGPSGLGVRKWWLRDVHRVIRRGRTGDYVSALGKKWKAKNFRLGVGGNGEARPNVED